MNNANNGNSLPVVTILKQAFFLPITRWVTILRFGTPLIVLSIIFVIYTSITPIQVVELSSASFTQSFLTLLLFCSTLLAIVGIHRTLLLEQEEIKNTKTLRWNIRETMYALWWIIIGIVAGLCSVPFILIIGFAGSLIVGSFPALGQSDMLTSLVWNISVIPGLYFFSRWILIVPATAIDELGHSFSSTWSLTRHNGWRLTLLLGIIPFIFSSLLEFAPQIDSLAYNVLVYILWIIIGIFEVSLLSLSYKYLEGK